MGEDFLQFWGISHNIRKTPFQSIVPPVASKTLEALINTYPKWEPRRGKFVISNTLDINKIMGSFCKQLYARNVIKKFIMFKNLTDFFGENSKVNAIKVLNADLTIIFEVGTCGLYQNQQQELVDILFTLHNRNKHYILCSRDDLKSCGKQTSAGIANMIGINCGIIKI